MEEEIRSEFEKSDFSIESADVLQKCIRICINHQISASDLVSFWEIYFLNRQLSGLKVESSHMDGFLSYIQNEMKERIIKEESHSQLHIYSSYDVGTLINDEYDDKKEDLLATPSHLSARSYLESYNSVSTPTTNEKLSTPKSAPVNNHITPFGQRTHKFVSQFTFKSKDLVSVSEEELGETDDDVIRRVQPSERCSLNIYSSQPEAGCRFMYDRVEDQFNSLENRIRRHAAAYTACGLYGEPTDATLASQKSLFAVGMVCCDGEGHLNDKSILLQGSVEHSGGQRVRLDLQKLPQFSLFPGQVIGIEGHNPSGHCLIASKVVDSLPITFDDSLPLAKRQAVDQEHQLSSSPSISEVLSAVVAAGPFTTTDNLYFEPLVELLAHARRKQPQLLILMGPFIDSEHPDIKKGTVDRTFDDIFHTEIIRRLLDYTGYMGSAARVVLVPSLRDASHDFVFPQPAFNVLLPEPMQHQITCVANPVLLSANEIKIGCCTTDILKHLSSEEISRISADASSGDRMGRLATHLLSQRSYYPLYPPSASVPFDFSLAPEALVIPSVPDIMLLPSDLAPFVKVLSLGEGNNGGEAVKCMCVNPGRLAKGIGGGTFVEINYNKDLDHTNASIIRI